MREYTSKPRPAREPIQLDGVEFHPGGGVSMLDLFELARYGDIDSASPEGMAAIGAFFRELFGPAEYPRFRKHCSEHSTDEETLLQILTDIVEEGSARPSDRPSDSQDGSTATGPMSKVVSLSRATVVEMPLTPQREAELRAAVQQAATG